VSTVRVLSHCPQGIAFEQDPNGAFTREWVPELKALPTKYIHAPWMAPEATLQQAGVVLGETYPQRIITSDMKVLLMVLQLFHYPCCHTQEFSTFHSDTTPAHASATELSSSW
jgi:FAD binding domain of DNA photolyase